MSVDADGHHLTDASVSGQHLATGPLFSLLSLQSWTPKSVCQDHHFELEYYYL